MLTKAILLYGKEDIRLEEFDLPAIGEGEILIKVVSDSVCMSTHKTYLQGEQHLRVPDTVSETPVIIGHEFCAEIVQVGDKWTQIYQPGEKVVIPPVLSYLGGMQTIGYSFPFIGGDSTYSIVAEHIIENGYLMKLSGNSFFGGSLIEPVSCVLRGYKGSYHLDNNLMPVPGIKPNGKMAILAGCGPMGLAAIDCALHGDVKPSVLVVTDLNEERLRRAESIYSTEKAQKDGIRLIFAKTADTGELLALVDGTGYDDVFVYAPVPAVVELGDSILAFDGCLNFFAGPTDKKFDANLNFYNVHYAQHHVSGTSGSTLEDMCDIVRLLGENRINPACMITHIGGLDAAVETTKDLPAIPGGKKLIYTHIRMPLTAIDDFEALGMRDNRFAELSEITKRHNGLWSAEAEAYLLSAF